MDLESMQLILHFNIREIFMILKYEGTDYFFITQLP